MLNERPLNAGDILLFHDDRPFVAGVLGELIELVRSRGLTFTTPAKWVH